MLSQNPVLWNSDDDIIKVTKCHKILCIEGPFASTLFSYPFAENFLINRACSCRPNIRVQLIAKQYLIHEIRKLVQAKRSETLIG